MERYVGIGRGFSILNRRSQLFVTEACEPLGLTYSEYVLLVRIFDAEGARQDELAAMLYLDKAVVTRTVKRLEGKGLVYREPDAKDKRVRHIYLTEAGKAQHAYLANILACWVGYLVEEMDPERVADIVAGLGELVQRACAADLRELAKLVPEEPVFAREGRRKNEIA